jgi:hypothetical protein
MFDGVQDIEESDDEEIRSVNRKNSYSWARSSCSWDMAYCETQS